MLFRKTIDPRCAYCRRGGNLENGQVICPKKGIVSEGDSCRSFVYDPLKRQPPAVVVPDFSSWDESDFEL